LALMRVAICSSSRRWQLQGLIQMGCSRMPAELGYWLWSCQLLHAERMQLLLLLLHAPPWASGSHSCPSCLLQPTATG
jgi:hypothetical protein